MTLRNRDMAPGAQPSYQCRNVKDRDETGNLLCSICQRYWLDVMEKSWSSKWLWLSACAFITSDSMEHSVWDFVRPDYDAQYIDAQASMMAATEQGNRNIYEEFPGWSSRLMEQAAVELEGLFGRNLVASLALMVNPPSMDG